MWPVTPKTERFWIRITYRSGAQFDVRCTKYTIQFNEELGELTGIDIEGMDKSVPKFFNLKAIESVYQLES